MNNVIFYVSIYMDLKFVDGSSAKSSISVEVNEEFNILEMTNFVLSCLSKSHSKEIESYMFITEQEYLKDKQEEISLEVRPE